MPCNSDYLNANNSEKELSKVLALLDELRGKPIPKDYGNGYDKRAYSKTTKELLDHQVSRLCTKLRALKVQEGDDKYSLELRMWWRDHQKADENRKKAEDIKKETAIKAAEALAKLTPEERKALKLR